jgi:peptidoglycan-associated lipoprotein
MNSDLKSDSSNKNNTNGLNTNDVQLKYSQKVLFDFDSYTINSSEKNALNSQIKYIEDNSCNVDTSIAGHADNRGTIEYNIVLGKNRANAVSSYLKGNVKCKNFKAKTISYGKSKPIASGDDEYSYAQNRRAETSISVKK